MSSLPNRDELLDVLYTWCNNVLDIEKISDEKQSQLTQYLENLQKQERDNSMTFTVDNIVKQYLNYLLREESQELQNLQKLTPDQIDIKIEKEVSDIMKVFHHPQFGRKYKFLNN